MIKYIEGGVCAAQGFRASGIHCGIRKGKTKKDLSLIVSDRKCSAAAVYTTNLVCGAPIKVTRANLADGCARPVICNSGNANTCNADGIQIAETMCDLVYKATGIPAKEVIVASTGVIGQKLDVTPIANRMDELVSSLSYEGSDEAAWGIMTTDTKLKSVAVEFEIGGKTCRIGGIAKGSGMIHPNMATMLVFVTSDVAITPAALNAALKEDVQNSFNMISVDGDTSTNDMLSVMANGMAGNTEIDENSPDFATFKEALFAVTSKLCRAIAADGEGATKLLECNVSAAADKQTARTVAKSVICSSLFKAAMFGADANWGRVLCAIGYSGAKVNVDTIGVKFASKAGEIEVCRGGAGVDFSEEVAKEILLCDEIQVNITLGMGDEGATAWGWDLTYGYVKINGDYRT